MRSKKQINRTFTLATKTISIVLRKRIVRVPSRVLFQLSPKARVIIDIDLPSDDYSTSNQLRFMSSLSIQLDSNTTMDASVGDFWRFGGGKLSGILIPLDQPVTVITTGRQMVKCNFALINFPNLWGSNDVHRPKDPNNPTGASIVIQRLLLEANPWAIQIVGSGSLMALDHRMKLEGGFGRNSRRLHNANRRGRLQPRVPRASYWGTPSISLFRPWILLRDRVSLRTGLLLQTSLAAMGHIQSGALAAPFADMGLF